MKLAEKAKQKKEQQLRKELELRQLQARVKKAGQMKLSAKERAFLAKRLAQKKKEALKRKKEWAFWKSEAQKTGKAFMSVLDELAGDTKPKKRKKKR